MKITNKLSLMICAGQSVSTRPQFLRTRHLRAVCSVGRWSWVDLHCQLSKTLYLSGQSSLLTRDRTGQLRQTSENQFTTDSSSARHHLLRWSVGRWGWMEDHCQFSKTTCLSSQSSLWPFISSYFRYSVVVTCNSLHRDKNTQSHKA